MKTILCGARGVACSFVSSALSCRNSSTSCAYIFLYTRNLSAARSGSLLYPVLRHDTTRVAVGRCLDRESLSRAQRVARRARGRAPTARVRRGRARRAATRVSV